MAMASMARAGSQAPELHRLARRITTEGFGTGVGLAQKDFEGEVRRLYAFVRDRIRYVRDPQGVELLADPLTTLSDGSGDCDDKSILLAALLLAVGHRCRFISIALIPRQFSHVWVQAQVSGRWIDLETTEPLQFGQRVPAAGVVAEIVQEV